jgi:hypothetical protein
LLIPSAVVLADSPGRREGFLRTRPLSGRDLFLAKALFVVALILLPRLVEEVIYLLASGLPAGYVVHGAGDLVVLIFPIAAIAAAFASLWRSYSQWARGLAIAFGGTMGCLLLLQLGLYLAGHPDALDHTSSASGASRTLAGLYAFSLVAILLAVGHARYAWGAVGRWTGIAAAILTNLLLNAYWPWDLVKLRPADPAAAAAVVSQSPLNVSLQDMQVNSMFGKHWDDRLDFGVDITPKVNRAVFPNLIEWNPRQVQLVNGSGQSFPPFKSPGYSANLRTYGNNPPADDLRIWAGYLPKEVFFRLSSQAYFPGVTSTYLGEYLLDSHAPWLREPVTLKARLEGRVSRWEKVADFALNTPASVKEANGSWTFIAAHRDNKLHQSHLVLKRSQVAFFTATDERTTDFANGPSDRHEYVLYNPQRNVALLTDNSYYNVSSARARSTALSQYWLDLTLADNAYGANNWKPLSTEDLAQCRLLIFEKVWLGAVPVDWQSPGWVIREMMNSRTANNFNGNNQNGLSRSEVLRRLAELPVPGPQATRAEVCRYLVQAVPIMDSSRNAQPPGEEAITQLATLVPGHLEVLLDGLPAMGSPSKSAVLEAIVCGAGESQKQQIIAAVPGNPDLIQVLFKRGWLADAQNVIHKLMDSPKPLSFEAVQAIAAYEDPATYPHLLAEFEANPSSEVYEILRTLPGLAAPLAASVGRLWDNHDRFVYPELRDMQTVLSLALRTGNREALRFVCRLLEETSPARNGGAESWGLAQLFRERVKLDGLKPGEEQNNQRVLDWMRKHRAEEFVFDPVRERFGLKP